MVLKSTEGEGAILRARLAVQRFPVVEWCQRMEDFHRRSIITIRQIASSLARRPSNGEAEHAPGVAVMDTEDWDPERWEKPMLSNWDTRSTYASPHSSIPGA